MESPIYDKEGKKIGSVNLPGNVFAVRWNADLVKQVVDSILSSRRKPVAHVKTRGEVRGGGKKPWKQKGTGRARHGSIRSPIWVGGGVAHGPRNDKNYVRKVTKKMRAKALHSILSKKFEEGEILFVDSLAPQEPKTREARKVLGALAKIKGFENLLMKRNNAALIALGKKDRKTERSLGNFSNMEVVEARNLDLISLLKYKYLVIEDPSKALGVLPGSSKMNKIIPTKKIMKQADKVSSAKQV